MSGRCLFEGMGQSNLVSSLRYFIRFKRFGVEEQSVLAIVLWKCQNPGVDTIGRGTHLECQETKRSLH